MASSGNFSTMNPLSFDNATFSKGNLLVNTDGNYADANSTFVMTSGKWYIEARNDGAGLSNFERVIGIRKTGSTLGTVPWSDSNKYVWFAPSGNIRNNSNVSYGSSWTADGDIIGIALDLDNNALWFSKNNTWQNSATKTEIENGTTTNAAFTGLTNEDGYTLLISSGDTAGRSTGALMYVNFGQDSTFGGDETAGGNADSNGFGDFFYAPPSGFLALCSANLPISDDIDPGGDDGADENPTKQFNAVLYTGNGSSNAITGLGFKPDLVWAKSRSASQSHRLYDSSRGGSSMLFPDTTAGPQTGSVFMTSFDTDGFTYSSSGSNANDSGKTYVAWCWRANGGTTASNSDGASTTTVQANTKAGFSIVECPTYTSNSTFGHGLNSAPEFITVKLLSTSRWATYHTGLTSAGYYVSLNTNDAQATGSFFNSTAPTSSVFSLGASFGGSGASIAYCWHSVEGYSKFGSYEGNGNNDGPFIYTGFRPRYWFFKEIDAADDWVAYDTARDTANTGSSKVLRYDSDAAEFDGTSRAVDVLSNGLKIRTSNGTINTSGNTYIYGAWGDVPFKYNNTF